MENFLCLLLIYSVMRAFNGWFLAFLILYMVQPDTLVTLGFGFAICVSWLFGSFLVSVRDEKVTKPLLRWFGIPANPQK